MKTVIAAFGLLLPLGIIIFAATMVLRLFLYKRFTARRGVKRRKVYLLYSILPAPLIGFVAGFAMLPIVAGHKCAIVRAELINSAYIALAFTYLIVTVFELSMTIQAKTCSKTTETE